MPDLNYGERRWWPHLIDYGGGTGAGLGVDPMTFAVHSEYINRPSTIVIDESGVLAMAYHGTFWGDRPTIAETIEMLRTKNYGFQHPERSRSTLGSVS